MTVLVTDWSLEGQSLGLWQKHCNCKGPVTIVCCRRGWKIVFMSSRFNNDAQSRYSPIEGEALKKFWAVNKADYFIYGCDKLYIGTDHKPLKVFFFRKVDPKPLYQIVNKRLRKYVSEINELRFTIFHISGMKNYLSYRGSRFPSSVSGDDRGEALDSTKKLGSTVKAISASSDIREYMRANNCWLPSELPLDLPTDCPRLHKYLHMVQQVQLVTQIA